jgi:hypothetical protein
LNETIHSAIFNQRKNIRPKRSTNQDQRTKPPLREQPIVQVDQRPTPPLREHPVVQVDQRPTPALRKHQVDQRPKPPIIEQPVQQSEHRPTPPLREKPKSQDSDVSQTDQRPVPDMREKPPDRRPKPSPLANTRRAHPVLETIQEESPTPPLQSEIPTRQSDTIRKTPSPPDQALPEKETDKQTLQDKKDDDKIVNNRPVPKPTELSEADRQALETAKRVAGNIFDDIDKAYDKIVEYNSACQELIKRVQKTNVEADTETDKIKTNIIRQAILLLTLRNTVLIERNKSKFT